MPLVDLPLSIRDTRVPRDVSSFLREAALRIEDFQRSSCVPGFVPSDFERAYSILRALSEADLAPGKLFCEWGSGFGVVTCLAALLDFEAYGIEIEGELVDAAQKLADDYGFPVEFACGSFIPKSAEGGMGGTEEYSWLTTEGSNTHQELGLAPDDLDVVFAYPWPDEEQATEYLFQRCAAVGAVLVTYHGGDDFRLRRKTAKRSRGA
ncbi:MAG TPA: hypothetical protein VE988_08405 [Gemmataceae bacterium]|nr:hypothetical protein [Gemmataceae bacterium]